MADRNGSTVQPTDAYDRIDADVRPWPTDDEGIFCALCLRDHLRSESCESF